MIKTNLAYLAGLIDGEGYIGIKRSKPYAPNGELSVKYHARIQVRMVEEAGIKLLQETLGGSYYREKGHCKNGRLLYCYQASDKLAVMIIKSLLPYLRIKNRQSELVIELGKLKENSHQYRTKLSSIIDIKHRSGKMMKVRRFSYSDEFVSHCNSLWQKCCQLNRVGYL